MQDLSLHILDVAENGVTAGANLIKITIAEDSDADRLTLTIEDNGRGMSKEFLAKALDPFVTTRNHQENRPRVVTPRTSGPGSRWEA